MGHTEQTAVICRYGDAEESGGWAKWPGLSSPGMPRMSRLAWDTGGGQDTGKSHSEKLSGCEWPHISLQAVGSSPTALDRCPKCSEARRVLGDSAIPSTERIGV